MEDQLQAVYKALTVDDSERLADYLRRRGVEAFVGQSDAPMYGADAGPEQRVVYVHAPVSEDVREAIADYEREFGKLHVPEAEWNREETGLELPKAERPSDDDPNEGIRFGVERMEQEAGPVATPETEQLVREGGRNPHDLTATPEETTERIRGIGADRSLSEMPDIERDEVENQPIDELDVERQFADPEEGTPSANLKGGNPRRRNPKRH